jgi:hypothetical protein
MILLNHMKKIFYYTFSLIIVFGISYTSVFAVTTLYTIPSQQQLSINKEMIVTIAIDTDEAINTLDLSLTIPAQFEVSRITDAGSIINLWVEKPSFNAQNRTVTLSGLVPGGYTGKGATVALITLKATTIGAGKIAFDAQKSSVLLHDGFGTKLTSVAYTSSSLSAVEDNGEVTPVIEDTESPERFTPIVTRDPLLYEGKWVLLFQTQDKNSGLQKYQVQESVKKTPDPEGWVDAQSPYVLKDQSRGKIVFVKAIDYQGNERVEMIARGQNKILLGIVITLCIILCLILIRNVYYRYGKKSQ